MASETERRKIELVERLAQLSAKGPGREIPAFDAFLRLYYDGVAPELLVEIEAGDLLKAALSLWQFALGRKPGAPKIRIFNPTEAEHGWRSSHTVIEIVNDDMPFLVDSVVNALNQRELMVHLLIHPIIGVRRDRDGKLLAVSEHGAAGTTAESVLHVELSRRATPDSFEGIRASLGAVLTDVRIAVEDWRAMHVRLEETIEGLAASPPPLPVEEVVEGGAFLSWIRDGNFTLLGMRDYELATDGGADYLRIAPESGLGVLRAVSAESAARHRMPLPPALAAFARRKELLIITKASSRATVHRPGYMDYIGVRRFDRHGNVRGERRIVGLFTSSAYNRNPADIPLLRRKMKRALDRCGFAPNSHNAKALLNILETYPRDELFQIHDDELLETTLGILHLEERQRLRLFVRRDNYARFLSCLVYIPRERYNTELRERIKEILLASFKAESAHFTTYLSDTPMARVHFILRAPAAEDSEMNVAATEARLVEASRMWTDDLRDALVARAGEAVGHDLYRRYKAAFPTGYRDVFSAEIAASDVERVEEALSAAAIAINLHRRADSPEGALNFKLYHAAEPVALSAILPILEQMGFNVVTEMTFRVVPKRARAVYVHDVLLRTPDARIDLSGIRENVEQAFLKVWSGEIENDGLNRLVVGAGLDWREVVVLRAYTRYLRQARITFSQHYIENTLARAAPIVRLLVALFVARLDPARGGDREAEAERIVGEIEQALEAVSNLEEDRILRRFLNLIESTLRTNYFLTAPDGRPKPYLSVKLDSMRIEDLPLPRPMFEIFVYSPRVEGIHLRGGKVARGGIRWSDRREDFRTEVLGLMKAQMVKNAVIVPVGSKGGFVVKQPPPGADRARLQEEVVECYKTLIRGMLDLTDNLVGGRVAPPPRVVRRDGDDPYLVVAADKGTATFSDIANGVAREYEFWLDDAFASGGSAGYDHKGMAITARGAWVSVVRHFRELGVDLHASNITVVGVGDMAGDVFGNGMLQSERIKLLGAFNHQHVFVDPDPDPARSFAERRRLFALPRSTWADYDPAVLSPGGGVFERSAKSITLGAEARKLFGIDRERLTPSELIRAMLKAPVDLVWLGGIGTFIKAAGESHADVGDRANDAVRIDGEELRCRVVGEGANLGSTQRGRIEYALSGGHINTDAIDNSGGVDCSDHEVNIKILLRGAVESGGLSMPTRDALLKEMTEAVAALVLRDNSQQTQSITVMLAQSRELLAQQARMMRGFERAGRLDRAIEYLPNDEDLATRRAAGHGLTRPEIAILLAYAKIVLFDELLSSNLPDDPLLFDDLVRYFPEPLQRGHRKALEGHRLRREIIANVVTNSMVNRVGPSFVHEMQERTGLGASDVARAYAITRDAFELRRTWAAIEALDGVAPAVLQTEMLIEAGRLVERSTLWFLAHGPHPLDVARLAAEFRPGIAELMDCLGDILSPERRERRRERAGRLGEQGVPADLARRVASLEDLVSALDIVKTARMGNRSVREVGQIYFAVGERFGLDWLRAAALRFTAESDWQRMAVGAIVDDVYGHQAELTVKVMNAAAAAPAANGVIECWVAGREQPVQRAAALLGDLRAQASIDIAMLAVANRQLRTLVAS